MKNREYVDFDDIVLRVAEVYTDNGYICSQCGKPFVVIKTNPETLDLEIFYDDKKPLHSDGCSAHALFDFSCNPIAGEIIPMILTINKHKFICPEFAFLYLGDRRN